MIRVSTLRSTKYNYISYFNELYFLNFFFVIVWKINEKCLERFKNSLNASKVPRKVKNPLKMQKIPEWIKKKKIVKIYSTRNTSCLAWKASCKTFRIKKMRTRWNPRPIYNITFVGRYLRVVIFTTRRRVRGRRKRNRFQRSVSLCSNYCSIATALSPRLSIRTERIDS